MTDTIDTAKSASDELPVIDAELVPVTGETQPYTVAFREVLERQLDAGHQLSEQLFEAATDAAVTIVESPAMVISAVRGGATLPAAAGDTRHTVRETVVLAGSRVRAAVGDYVGQQAVLPNAVITGAAEVAGALVRAQGELTASAVSGTFAVATTATHRGDVRDAIDREWSEFNATAVEQRDSVEARIAVARQSIRDAIA